MSQQYRMSNRYIALLVLALLFFSAYSQDAVQTQNAATNEAPKVETPPPQAPTSSQESPKVEATPAAEDYVARINKIREQVANSKDLDHKYLEQKINEVIASLTPQQKEQFESGLSSEARAAYEHYKQERQRQMEKQHEQERQMEGAAAELSLTEQTLKREMDELRQYQEINSIKYNDYQFQLESMASQDLQFTLPIDQRVAFVIHIFTDDNGVFGTVKEIEGEQPIRVYVYENRDRIVADGSFYSIKPFMFQGKANTTYLVRFSNNGKKKLVAFYMSHILLDAHVGSKLTVEDVADHGQRIRDIKDHIDNKLQEQKNKLMLEKENEKRLITAFGHYYFYNIGEIVLLGIICVIQVESIRKLLVATSVV